jgi:hypothetical protein
LRRTGRLIKNGRYAFGKKYPVVQETHLGWVLLGHIPKEGADRSTALFICNEPPMDFKLQRFWKQEEIVAPVRTREDEAVETHFVETTIRDETGRFIVRVPRHSQDLQFGNSYYGPAQVPTSGKKVDKKSGASRGLHEVHG